MRSDERADRIINHMLVSSSRSYYLPVLNRLVELGRIEPLDTEGFTELILNSSYGAALRMYSSHPVEPEFWFRLRQELFMRIKPI
jgi:hypothetical protein